MEQNTIFSKNIVGDDYMNEYHIYDLKTKKRDIIFGYTLEDACCRFNYCIDDVIVELEDYID